MYLGESVEAVRLGLFALVNDMVAAAPSTVTLVDQINNEILTGSLYKALKAAKKLIQYEQGIFLDAASGGAGVPAGRQADRKPADLEANLLSRSAADLQRIRENWDEARDELPAEP